MKKIAFILATLLAAASLPAQSDEKGNPVFNSELISEEKLDGFELTCSYYTIANNISNKKSSVYVSDAPSPSEYLKFSRDLPAYFFIAHRGQEVIAMISLLQKNEGSKTTLTYLIVNPANGKSVQVPCGVYGEIAEKRVDELMKLKVDTAAKLLDFPNGKSFLFNGIVYRVQPYDRLKEEVIALAKQLADAGQAKEEIKDPVAYAKAESVGGKMDYNKVLENKTEAFFMVDGVAYNKSNFAIFLWGAKVKELGIAEKKAVKLWEEIHQRKLTDPEKRALLSGYKKK